ncbi:hypothetical protein ACFZC3_15390 [Streptomyces sp. NPDC007903]|uniref:hypothetical protein n=1 Tax=Streptomyces sp. NPDC007903 TaxID=3364786 RepID=UPI0036EF8201
MVDPQRLTAPQIAQKYGRKLTTITTDWTQRPAFPDSIGRDGQHKTYDAQAVADFVRDHIDRPTVEWETDRLYTAKEIEGLTGIKAATIRADKNRGRWPQADDTSGRADKWLGSTITTALSGRRGYHRKATTEDKAADTKPEAQVHAITTLGAAWQPGDVVLDADGNIRVRSDHPKWAWDYAFEGSVRDHTGGPAVPEGALEEHDVPRPLTLLIRDGQPVGGRLIKE